MIKTVSVSATSESFLIYYIPTDFLPTFVLPIFEKGILKSFNCEFFYFSWQFNQFLPYVVSSCIIRGINANGCYVPLINWSLYYEITFFIPSNIFDTLSKY